MQKMVFLIVIFCALFFFGRETYASELTAENIINIIYQLQTQVDVLKNNTEQQKMTFAKLPLPLQKISICESSGKQFTSSGGVITSATHDHGIMQINSKHIKRAQSKGYDIFTPEGNMGFAMVLWKEEGLYPWVCARKLGLI